MVRQSETFISATAGEGPTASSSSVPSMTIAFRLPIKSFSCRVNDPVKITSSELSCDGLGEDYDIARVDLCVN